jgi:hypothetical protein
MYDERDDILRTEWAKSRARMTRSKEEVMLLKEEMRRVAAFLHWKQRWWREREEGRKDVDGALLEGLRAYGRRQGLLQKSLSDDFIRIWQSMSSITQLLDECRDDDAEDDEDEDEGEDEGGEDGHGDDDDDDDDDDDNPVEG